MHRILVSIPTLFFILAVLFVLQVPVEAAKVDEVSRTSVGEQAVRFLRFKDPSLRYAVIGSILLGACCGLLGSFIVVRKMSLVGDALSHAVLPGVALGFLWNMQKDPIAIFVGATIAGLLGSAVVNWITQTTKLKEDTALGLVLATFFAVGICLMTMIQRLPSGNKSGIDKFLFGQAAAISDKDVYLMAIITAFSLLVVFLFFKELVLSSFDADFARAIGLPTGLIHHGLMMMLAFAVVIALQAVGVVLVSAMLITPAASAYLLTDRMHRLVLLSALIGMGAGLLGCFFSFLGNNFPTGPFLVLATSIVFFTAFLIAPRHGVLTRMLRRQSRSRRIRRENTLKSIYHVLEANQFSVEGIFLRDLAERRKETFEEIAQQIRDLQSHGLSTSSEDGEMIFLTPEGWQRACAIVRNHRLWELYLTNAAQIAADHVHEDAEKIEHVLGEEVVRELERRLEYPVVDPHGKKIPGMADQLRGMPSPKQSGRSVGYGRDL